MFQEVRQFFLNIWWALLAYTIATKYVIWELYIRKFAWGKKTVVQDFPRQDGRYAIVTGGSRGIGLEIVHNLLAYGYSVIIGSSSSEENRKALQQSLQKNLSADSGVEVWHLDLASHKSVKNFAEKYISTKKPLHLLINNAGIMFVKKEITEDGYEKHFAVNYLSHCLLTRLLIPLLSKSGTQERHARIINCSSCIHYVGSRDVINFKDIEHYSKYKAYIQSKLAQVLFTYSLHTRMIRNKFYIDVNCVHPGVVNTELMTSALLFPIIGMILFKNAKEGAHTATYVALSTEMEGNGGNYLEENTIFPSCGVSYDTHLQQELWDKTMNALELWLCKDGFE